MAIKWEQDPVGRRRRILDAAHVEFALHGFDGARVDRIAERSEANKRSIYYLVGNKEDLYLAVLEETYQNIRTAELGLKLTEVEPREAITRLVRFTWEYFLKHPEFIRILNTENLHKAKYIKKSKLLPQLHSPFIESLRDVLKRGAEANEFRNDMDPVDLYISIAGLCWFYHSNSATLSVIFARDLMAPRRLAAHADHVVSLVLDALAPRATVDPAGNLGAEGQPAKGPRAAA